MWALRFAATIAAIVTVVLNAHHGYISSTTIEYAVMLAALNAALDLGKTALIPAAVAAWRNGAYLIALISLTLFPPLFCNSVWNALSQVALTRSAAATTASHDIQSRDRDLETRRRKVAELSTLEANPSFQASAACALPKTKDARALCQTVTDVKTELDAIDTRLAKPAQADREPAITWLASITAMPHTVIALIVTSAPVLLAELLGSLGFVIAAAQATKAEPNRTALEPVLVRRLGWWRRTSKNASAASPAPSDIRSRAPSMTAPAQVVSWSIGQ